MTKRAKQIILGICIVVLLAGTLPWLLTRIGLAAFNGSPGTARVWWTMARYTSVYERDVILYNIGNSFYKQRSYDEAANMYAKADDISRDKTRCAIRYNWGLALSDKGDQLASTDRPAARAAYSEALRILAISTCQDDPAYQASFNALAEALTEKLQDLTEDDTGEDKKDEQQSDTSKAEEILKDAEKEKREAQDYQNQRRSDKNREALFGPDGDGTGGGVTDQFRFVW